jgi:hypothetical protein
MNCKRHLCIVLCVFNRYEMKALNDTFKMWSDLATRETSAKSRCARRTAKTAAGASGPTAAPAFTATPADTARSTTEPDRVTGEASKHSMWPDLGGGMAPQTTWSCLNDDNFSEKSFWRNEVEPSLLLWTKLGDPPPQKKTKVWSHCLHFN